MNMHMCNGCSTGFNKIGRIWIKESVLAHYWPKHSLLILSINFSEKIEKSKWKNCSASYVNEIFCSDKYH